MNCVRYDPETFQVTGYGTISEEAFASVVDEGLPIIAVDSFPSSFAIHLYDIDRETKTLVFSPNPRPNPNSSSPSMPDSYQMPSISDRQFFMKAAIDGYITQEDALKAVQSGFIPAPIQANIDAIQNPNVKFQATMLFSGSNIFYRPDPLVESLLLDFGLKDETSMNEFWRIAAQL